MVSENSIVDVFNTLNNDAKNNSLSRTTSLLSSKGISAINVGEFDARTAAPLWVLSTMRRDWLDHYMNEGFYEDDPFVQSISSGQSYVRADCGSIPRQSRGSSKEINLNHGLKDAGYGVLHGVLFPVGSTQKRKLVTLCLDEKADVTDLTVDMFSIAAFIAATFQNPTGDHPDRLKVPLPVVLTRREQDALLYLTSGHQVSQIAHEMGVSETMVHRHLSNACKKLGASTREEAIARALMADLLPI